MKNINDTFFEGFYKDIWKQAIPTELTAKEVDFMLSYFSLKPGMKVWDLMCGYGRHSIALAEKGIEVTCIDNSSEYIQEIQDAVQEKALPIRPVHENLLNYIPNDKFDLAICMGNSLNFFPTADVQTIFNNVSSILSPNGNFLINTWSIAEIAFKNFKANGWAEIGGYKFLTDSKIIFHPTRIETNNVIIDKEGIIEERVAIDYVYSISEIESMLLKAGLKCNSIYSIPGKKKFLFGEPRAYIVASKL